MVRVKERDTKMPNVVEFQDLDTITAMSRLCRERILSAPTPTERNTYQRLLKFLNLRFRELQGKKAAKVSK